MKKILIAFATTLILALGYNTESIAQVVKVKPNRPDKMVHKPAKAKKGHVWRDGHWHWDTHSKKYIWKKGQWAKHKKGHKWVAGHWVDVPGKGHKWVPGHWKKH